MLSHWILLCIVFVYGFLKIENIPQTKRLICRYESIGMNGSVKEERNNEIRTHCRWRKKKFEKQKASALF